MDALLRVALDPRSYLSECDYQLNDWQRACWGEHWPRLSHIKQCYDPDELFVVHHGVSSGRWIQHGFAWLRRH